MHIGLRLSAAIATGLLCCVSTDAVAWQRPKAQAAPKTEACPEMGDGFVRIAGSTTCVKLSGLVRVEVAHGGGGPAYEASGH